MLSLIGYRYFLSRSGLGRTILGPSERVKNFSRANLIDFIAQHYHPERMILSAAGGIDHDEIIRLAEASFGTLPKRAAPENFGKAKFVGGISERKIS